MKFLALLRSLVVLIVFPLIIVTMGPVVILGHYLFHSRKLDDWFLTTWGRLCCWMCGVTVVVEGQEKIPAGGCLFLFNHASFFDIFALAGYLPGVRFGAKVELFKIPIFAQAMRVLSMLPIARQNREEVYKIYEEAKIRFSHGEQFALSPEGGRFYGQKLSPFKAGPFVFAISAGVPVVPVLIIGAYEVWPKRTFLANKDRLSRTIFLKILAPIATENLTQENRKKLQNEVYDKMNSVWEKERSIN